MSQIEASGFILYTDFALIVGWGETMDKARKSVDPEYKDDKLESLAASSQLLSEIAECGPDNVSWLTCDIDGVKVAIEEIEEP